MGRPVLACVAAACVFLGVHGAHASDSSRATKPYRLMEVPEAALKPRFSLLDKNFLRRHATDFSGRITVVFFGFTHCQDVCPGELFKLAQVMKRLGSLNLQVLFISLDPERDTPEIAQNYAAIFDPRFIGLSGSAAEINSAASSFSVQFANITLAKSHTITHSSGTYVLDEQGRLRLVGTSRSSVADWVHDLSILDHNLRRTAEVAEAH